MHTKQSILLTNDDGIGAPGMYALYEALKNDFSVTVVAPGQEMSGVGHSFTYKKPVYIRCCGYRGSIDGYCVEGTPADCVKLGIWKIMRQRPDIVVSGINNGSNTGIAGYYSGTVAAAREGAFCKIDSIAFSLPQGGAEYGLRYGVLAAGIIRLLCKKPGGTGRPGVFYNVNFPLCHPDLCKGIVMTRQSLSCYADFYSATGSDERGAWYQLEGDFADIEPSIAYDTGAVLQNYIAVTPLSVDATAHAFLCDEQGLEKIFDSKE